MARASDEQKRREWVERFERFRAGGATVAQFCGHERVSVNTFYYWSKRVGSAVTPQRRLSASKGLVRATVAGAVDSHHDGGERRNTSGVESTLVRFRFGSMEVDVPADCLDVIRCLAESAGRPASHGERLTPGSFHQIVLSSRR